MRIVARMSLIRAWFLAIRPKTLPAAMVPVAVGGALAYRQEAFSLVPWSVCLVFGLMIQIGTNFANDYYDALKGADGPRRIGPKRAVASGWISPGAMRAGTVVVFAAAFSVGCLLLPYGGPWLLLVGVLSVLCGIAYTGGPYPLGYNGLGDLFVFLFFGWVATVVTFFVQAGPFWQSGEPGGWIWPFIAGMVPGALATNLLVVNNVRDAPLDKEAGKRTVVVRFGLNFGLSQYGIMLLVAFGAPLLFAWRSGAWVGILPLLALPLALSSWRKLSQATGRADFESVLVRTALLLVTVGSLFVLSLVVSRSGAGAG